MHPNDSSPQQVVNEKDVEEESKSLNVMDVEDEKGKPRERVKAGRRSESALEHRGDNDEEVGMMTPCKEDNADDLDLIDKEGEHTD